MNLPIALKLACVLLVLWAFFLPTIALAEFAYWNLNGERRFLPDDFSFSDMAREINSMRKATEELSVPTGNSENPEQVWKRGLVVFDMFFSHFAPEANAAIRLAELDSFEGEINSSELKAQSRRWRRKLRQSTQQIVEMRSLLGLLPSEKRVERNSVKTSLNELKKEVERCNKVLHAIDKLQALHNLFTTNILRYQRYLIDDLAYELKSKLPLQISKKAERAIDRWFAADGDLAVSFLKHLSESRLSEASLGGAAAKLESLATARLAPSRLPCGAFRQLVPRAQ